MDVRPIRNEDDYNWALAEIEKYFDNPPPQGTPESDRFDVLFTLAEAYESEVWPIEAATPLEVLEEYMLSNGRTQSDLAQLFGSRARASEVLNGKRRLTLDMIGRLSREWRIPADLLIGPAPSSEKAA
jgi:HTH-type transcriptional regulator/antitoxin HigA